MSPLKTCLLAILAITVLVTFASPAQASDTIQVCPTSFPATGAISAAVATAASGTTISLCPGVYYDNVVINQEKVKVIGQGKSGAVQVFCNDPSGYAFDLEAYDDYVQNMEITGCYIGVFIDGSSGGKDGVIRDNIIECNTVGVEAYQTTTATVQANTFTSNSDRAILDYFSTSSDFGSNTIVGCKNRPALTGASVDVLSNTVECSSQFGIELEGASKASVNSNHISQAVLCVSVDSGTTGSSITKNKVTDCEVAIYMDQAGNNTFTGNEADSSLDGFLATLTTGQASINGKPNVIENNTAKGNSVNDLQDQSTGTEADYVGNKWHKNTCGTTGSSPTSLCTD